MKNIKRLLLFLFIISLSGCMSGIYVNVMKPAPITIPPHIKTIAIVNRTLPERKIVNIIEGIITGEGIGQDKQGVQYAIDGLYTILTESPRFEVKFTNEELKGSGSGTNFPPPLSWTEVIKITKRYGTDAVATIETYDSDFIITKGSRPVKKKDSEGREITVKEFYAEGVGSVKLGFRLYDPVKKNIVDQYHFSHNMRWKATGNSLADAVAHLMNKRAAVNKVSNVAGRQYGRRIAPSWVRVHREYYKKPKKNLEMSAGARKAQVNDWEGAIESWLNVLNNADTKLAGRATFNLALANEVLGYLEEAKKWATRSYTEFGNKKARYYVGTIEQRIWEEEKLRQQMEGQD